MPPRGPDNQQSPPPTLAAKINDYQGKLGINGPVKTIMVPNDPNIRLNTPVSQLPPGSHHGLSPEDMNRPIGEILGAGHDDMSDPDFANTPAHDFLDLAGGGGYVSDTGTIGLQNGAGDRTLFHEMGHVQQHEHGYTGRNTNNSVLEYHNVLSNENSFDGTVRDNYTLDQIPPGQRNPTQSWSDLHDHINQIPDPLQRYNTQQALGEIETMLNTDPRYTANRDQIQRNLIAEYFARNR